MNVRSTARGKAEQPLGDIDSTLRTTLADIQVGINPIGEPNGVPKCNLYGAGQHDLP